MWLADTSRVRLDGAIAGREDTSAIRPRKVVDHDPLLAMNTGTTREFRSSLCTDTDEDEVGVKPGSVSEENRRDHASGSFDSGDLGAEENIHSSSGVCVTVEVRYDRCDHTAQETSSSFDHVRSLAGSRCHYGRFQTDEAAADNDDVLGTLKSNAQRGGVCQVTQVQNARQIRAGHPESSGSGTRCEDKVCEAQFATRVGHGHAAG